MLEREKQVGIVTTVMGCHSLAFNGILLRAHHVVCGQHLYLCVCVCMCCECMCVCVCVLCVGVCL